jgi:hypothetical protein
VEQKVLVSELEPGDYFDDALPAEAPSRDRYYRVVGVRSSTVLAENVVGIRRSFTKSHETQRGTKEVWEHLRAAAQPATPAERPQEGGAAEVA